MRRQVVVSSIALLMLFSGSMFLPAFATGASSSVTIYPDLSSAPSSDVGCGALTNTVSGWTGALDSSLPSSAGSGAIDQEDTSYNENSAGASFCSFQYSGSTMTLTSVSAALFLVSNDPYTTDTWLVNVSLTDLTTCTSYSSSSPCPSIASASETLTGIPTASGSTLGSCYDSMLFSLSLAVPQSTSLTQGDSYGLVVSSVSSLDNGYNALVLCTGGEANSFISISGTTSSLPACPPVSTAFSKINGANGHITVCAVDSGGNIYNLTVTGTPGRYIITGSLVSSPYLAYTPWQVVGIGSGTHFIWESIDPNPSDTNYCSWVVLASISQNTASGYWVNLGCGHETGTITIGQCTSLSCSVGSYTTNVANRPGT